MREDGPVDVAALMRQYAGRVYRLALSITRNSADAEEVVQDVFFNVYRKSATFEGRSAFGSWLYRIALNAALNRRRGKRGLEQISLDQLAQSYDGSVRIARATLDWSQTPEQRVLADETRTVLSTAVNSLPAHYRMVVVLKDVEARPSADVVELLHASAPCVKTRLHRARLVLRERLSPYFSERRRRPG
jgi:RNA polymerase sigma-70 factor, ECF subfamily